MSDTLTVIRSPYLRLAKAIHADGRIEAYGRAKTIDLFEMPVSNLDAIASLLGRLVTKPACAVVFGGVADPTRTRRVRRLAYPDPKTGDLATLTAMPHWWCALDMDGVARPENVPASDLVACAAEAVQRLPAAFQGVSYIVQASASHGIKPGCRLHLWFWLSRPTSGGELSFWLKQYPVDPCTFRPAQPIYTAAPVFVGRQDHLPSRIAAVWGASAVSVPSPEDLTPPERPPVVEDREASTDADVEAFVDEAIARVRSAPDNGKHYALRNMARLLGGIQAKAGFSDSEVVRWLVDALPGTAIDLNLAKGTAEWGLDAGRPAPIPVPHREPREPDPRRKAAARAAFRLLRMNVPSDVLLATLYDLNERQPEPLPAHVIADTALWAARQPKGRPHAG